MAFKKGLPSPNPSGRPRGNATAAKLRELLSEDLEGIIHTLKSLAKSGDVSAIKLILDKVVPSLRPQAETFTLETIPSDSMADIGRLIINSVLRAEIPADAGAQLLGAIAAQCKVVETTEILETLARLEGAK